MEGKKLTEILLKYGEYRNINMLQKIVIARNGEAVRDISDHLTNDILNKPPVRSNYKGVVF